MHCARLAEPAGAAANVEVIDPDGHRPLSLSEARTVAIVPPAARGFYQIRFANGRDAVIGVNPDRRESDLQPIAAGCAATLERKCQQRRTQTTAAAPIETTYRAVSLWWYVMLLALVVALAETTFASGYMGTQREEV